MAKQRNYTIPIGHEITTAPGQFKIKGVATGSYGETGYRQIGKDYDDVLKAVAAAIQAVARGYKDVVLINNRTGKRFMLDNVLKAMAEIADAEVH